MLHYPLICYEQFSNFIILFVLKTEKLIFRTKYLWLRTLAYNYWSVFLVVKLITTLYLAKVKTLSILEFL